MSTPNPHGPRPQYTEEFKADAVAMVTELGKSRSQVAEDLQVSASTLGRWVATATGITGTGRGSPVQNEMVGLLGQVTKAVANSLASATSAGPDLPLSHPPVSESLMRG